MAANGLVPPSVPADWQNPQVARPVRWRGCIIGHVDEDDVFWRRVKPGQALEHPPAIALNLDALEAIAAAGARVVAFRMPGGEILFGPLSLYETRGFDVDRRYGPQRAVLLADFWRVDVQPLLPGFAHVG